MKCVMSGASLQKYMTHLKPLFGRESRQKVFQRENLLLGSESSEINAAAVGRHLWTFDTAVKRDARSLCLSAIHMNAPDFAVYGE